MADSSTQADPGAIATAEGVTLHAEVVGCTRLDYDAPNTATYRHQIEAKDGCLYITLPTPLPIGAAFDVILRRAEAV